MSDIAVEAETTDRIDGYRTDLEIWRHDLHQHPELAFEEHRTSAIVAEQLESFAVEVHRGLGGTGIVGVLRAGSSPRAIALRADMDALPIEEQTGLPYASGNPGVMHACGHDGHTTMLLGAARYLAETRAFDGTVYFVFQPAEERGGGGLVMIRDGLFDRFPAERVFGMHNFPGIPVGEFALCEGPMMAAVDEFSLRVTGDGGHAAFPHLVIDTAVTAAQIVLALQTVVARNVDPLESAVVSVTTLHGGDAFNVIPADVRIGGTVRTFQPSVQDLIERRIGELARQVAGAHGAGLELVYERGYPATVNTTAEVAQAARAAAEVGTAVDAEMTPIMGSEDFAYMLQERPGAYIGLGNGASAGLHTPRYDFDDAALVFGAKYWARLVETQLPR